MSPVFSGQNTHVTRRYGISTSGDASGDLATKLFLQTQIATAVGSILGSTVAIIALATRDTSRDGDALSVRLPWTGFPLRVRWQTSSRKVCHGPNLRI